MSRFASAVARASSAFKTLPNTFVRNSSTSNSQLLKTLDRQRFLRKSVSDGMLETYTSEVPLMKVLNDAVHVTNIAAVKDPNKRSKLGGLDESQLGDVRHAAVRIALREEVEMFARMMNQLGMFPVAFYDLTKSGTPVMSTVFRPIADINKNAFTIFTSMLVPDAVDFSSNPKLEEKVKAILEDRRQRHFKGEGIFTKRLIDLIEKAETQTLSEAEQQEYVKEVIAIFQLKKISTLDEETYNAIKKICPVTADILGALLNINHLTPDTLDIDAVYAKMLEQRIEMNPFITGPDGVGILLRQTSFAAQLIKLLTSDGKEVLHQARFGEVEERGLAISRSARAQFIIAF